MSKPTRTEINTIHYWLNQFAQDHQSETQQHYKDGIDELVRIGINKSTEHQPSREGLYNYWKRKKEEIYQK